MAIPRTTIVLTHGPESYQTIKDKLLHSTTVARREMVALRNFFHAAAGEDRLCTAKVQVTTGDEVFASSTVTVLAAAIGDTAVVNGVTFTAVDHKELSNVTAAADSSGSLNSTWFKFQDQTGAFKYYVWFSINNAGVDPQVPGRVGIKIIGATNATAATLAAAITTACAGTNSAKVTFGADSSGSLNNTYFTFKDLAGVNAGYFWFNINKAGVDPAPAGTGKGIMVAGATGATAAALATAAFNAFAATQRGDFQVTNASSGVINIYGADGNAAIVKDSVATSTQFVMVQQIHGVNVANGASTHTTFQSQAAGITTALADGTAATGFSISRTITGSAVTSIQYDIGTTDTAAAANLAAAINANSSMVTVATATSAAAVVTVSSFYPGPVGNNITLTATTGNTAGASKLANGAVATTTSTLNTYRSGT